MLVRTGFMHIILVTSCCVSRSSHMRSFLQHIRPELSSPWPSRGQSVSSGFGTLMVKYWNARLGSAHDQKY